MKLCLLNGAHSLMAYAGFLGGHAYILDVMADDDFEMMVALHLACAARTLPPVAGLDLDLYCTVLIEGFQNPNTAHKTYQIAMDGSEKLPQRIFEPAQRAIALDLDASTFALATAAWIAFCFDHLQQGTIFDVQDPRRDEIKACLAPDRSAADIVDQIFALNGFVPHPLAANDIWRGRVVDYLATICADGIRSSLRDLLGPIQSGCADAHNRS